MIFPVFALLVFFSATLPQHTDTLLDKGYDDMYNLAFADAHHCFQQWQQEHPNDAMGPVSDAAAYLFSEFDRLHILQSQFFVDDNAYFGLHSVGANPAVKAKFQADLNKTAQLADNALKQSPKDKQALLAKVLMMGLDSDYKSLIEKQNIAALTEIKSGTTIAQTLLQAYPDCYDAHLASGIQNYLLSLKSAPVRWILRISGAQTDKETGLADLKIVAEKGRYLKPYANLLLAVAALRDKNPGRAKQILSELAAQFPGNSLYREELKKLS